MPQNLEQSLEAADPLSSLDSQATENPEAGPPGQPFGTNHI